MNVPTVLNADANMDTSGAWFVPIVDVTHDDDDAHSHMSDIPLQRPASAHFPLNTSALATLSPARSDAVRNVHGLQPRPNQTGLNPWHLQNPQSVPAVLGPREAVGLVTQRAREALHDQCATVRRALLPQQEEFLGSTHQYQTAARQNLVNTLARHNKEQNYIVQMQIHHLEQEADARFFTKNKGIVEDILSGSKSRS